jgi:hydroxymethylpyrimidine kinase / phosphomethylpyrimidine kinase / thiamine-phosphate diphosphorylase
MNKTIWTIAGSDASGGAGIQADIKAMASFGLQGASVITALTAQNSLGVLAVNAIAIDVIASQLNALEQDKLPQVIKIGLLANCEQVEFIAAKLRHYKKTWPQAPLVVYDPVAVASSGDSLVEQDILAVVKEKFLPLVDVLTPNTDEIQKLSGVYLISPQAIVEAAQVFNQLGVKSVVFKGGHWHYIKDHCIDLCADFLAEPVKHYWLASENIPTMHSHGTGCTFASVIAACLTLEYPLKDAFVLAKAYINQGLKAAKQVAYGLGSVAQLGFPDNLADFPEVIENQSVLGQALELVNKVPIITNNILACNDALVFPACESSTLGLYAVVDTLEFLQICFEQGIKTVQLRIKDKNDAKLVAKVRQAVSLSQQYQAQLFINDHWQLAINCGAYGVHLGQEDLENADLVAIKQAGLRLGISSHGFYEILRAHNYQPSYIAFGAIFSTQTKDMSGQIQGLSKLKHFVALMKNDTNVAIGGINISNVEQVLATGIKRVAVVSAIIQAENPKQAIALLQQKIANYWGI